MQLKRLIPFLLCLLPMAAYGVGTCTVTDVTSTQNVNNRIPDSGTVIVTLTCTADASAGTFPATTVPLTGASPSTTILNAYNLRGYYLYEVGRTPGATNPTANYTVTIKDTTGFALDLGLLTTNGTASTPQLTGISSATAPYPVYPVVRSALTVQISANAVNSANITLDLIFRATL